MAGYQALAAVGLSLITLLKREFATMQGRRPTPVLARSTDFDDEFKRTQDGIQLPIVAIYCYRLTVDKATRPGWSGVARSDGRPRIPLNMHLQLSAWDTHVEYELQWLGKAATVLETHPVLTGPQLDPLGDWGDGDAVQIVTDDLPLESLSEAFQAFPTKFRCAMFYVARVVVLGGPQQPVGERVTTVADRLDVVRT